MDYCTTQECRNRAPMMVEIAVQMALMITNTLFFFSVEHIIYLLSLLTAVTAVGVNAAAGLGEGLGGYCAGLAVLNGYSLDGGGVAQSQR